MRRAAYTLARDIGGRHRLLVAMAAGLLVVGALLNGLVPESWRAVHGARERWAVLHWAWTLLPLFLVFGMFNYTEFNAAKEWTGFPHRLFVLPVPTWLLVLVPMSLGLAAVEVVYLLCTQWILAPSENPRPAWFATLWGAGMVSYQAILWGLAGFRFARILSLALAGVGLFGLGFMPFFERYFPGNPWLSEKWLRLLLTAVTLGVMGVAWGTVARQRCGGGRGSGWLQAQWDRWTDSLPSPWVRFSSAPAALFWFEWRRSGWLLPACIGCLILGLLAPVSWFGRHDPERTAWTLAWTLGAPLLLAATLGKGLSKPDFWSRDLSLPSFLAVRPVATGELLVAKMKVAALSAGLSWFLVVGFLSLWLPLWADLSWLNPVRVAYWMVYGHTLWPQYVMALLGVGTGILLTWRCLIGDLWVGLSGERRWLVAWGILQGGVALLVLVGSLLLANSEAVQQKLRTQPEAILATAVWLLALVVVAKAWLAVWSWRHVSRGRVRAYCALWCVSTLVPISFAWLVAARGSGGLALVAFLGAVPLDGWRLEGLLFLLAVMSVPLARLGLAGAALDKNRHR